MLLDTLLVLFKVVHQTQGSTTSLGLYLCSLLPYQHMYIDGVTPLYCRMAGDRDRVCQRVSEFVFCKYCSNYFNYAWRGPNPCDDPEW